MNTFLKFPINLSKAPFWVQSWAIVNGLDLLICGIKGFCNYKLGYVLVHGSISLTLMLITIFYLTPTSLNHDTMAKVIAEFEKNHQWYFSVKISNYKEYRFLCFRSAVSRLVWLIGAYSALSGILVSIKILLLWDCTIYLRILFAINFFTAYFCFYVLKSRYHIKYIYNIQLTEPVHQITPQNIAPITAIEAQQHPFHLLKNSGYPIMLAASVFCMLFFLVRFVHFGKLIANQHGFIFGLVSVLFVLYGWFKEIGYDADNGFHTKKVRWNLLHGMALFIVSEIMLFFAIFWGFFHSSLAPTVAIFCMWPPLGIQTIYPFGLPFLNTVLLISSGISLTYGHRALLLNNFPETARGLILTLILGGLFTYVQGFEYAYAPFSINDGIYGSTFYFSTGFHGLHVIIGSLFLLWSFFRNERREFTSDQHVGLISASWYWHFVDIVWIFLFLSIYWWGSS